MRKSENEMRTVTMKPNNENIYGKKIPPDTWWQKIPGETIRERFAGDFCVPVFKQIRKQRQVGDDLLQFFETGNL